MKFFLRVFLAMAFALWALPKLVELSGGPDSLNPRNLLDRQDQYEADFTANQQADNDDLVATLDDLSIYDSGLRRCITRELRGSGRNLSHASQLTRLLCDSMGINSLRGLDRLPKLKSLSLRNNNITSIAGITNLASLESIDLHGNPEIRDFTQLTYLNNLSHVNVSNLSGTYCHEVEEVFEHARSNKSSFNQGPSVKSMMRGISCRGKGNFDVERLLAKKRRGEALSVEESRQLRDYQSDQRWR